MVFSLDNLVLKKASSDDHTLATSSMIENNEADIGRAHCFVVIEDLNQLSLEVMQSRLKP